MARIGDVAGEVCGNARRACVWEPGGFLDGFLSGVFPCRQIFVRNINRLTLSFVVKELSITSVTYDFSLVYEGEQNSSSVIVHPGGILLNFPFPPVV